MLKKVNDNEILWARVKSNAKIPAKLKENAGYDIYACFDEDFIAIPCGGTKLIPTGLACALSDKYYLQLEERGSTESQGIKRSAGVVDSGYRGEIFVALTNCSGKDILISKLDREKLHNTYFGNKCRQGKENLALKTENCFIFPCDEASAIIYPYDKAICQGIVHIIPDVESREVNYDELRSYGSERGEGNLGSRGK